MRRHLIFLCCLISFVFVSNFYWMIETSPWPYGDVTYKVEMDSASLNQIFYDLEVARYKELLEKGEAKPSDTIYINKDREKGSFSILLNNNIEIYFHLEDDGKVVLSSASYKKIDRPLIYEFFGALGVPDYIEWHSFEKEVLDKFGLKYRKRWGLFIRKWYANWFFRNQLYIAGLAILIHIVCSIIRNIKHKNEYRHLVFLFCLGALVFGSDIFHRVEMCRNPFGEVCYRIEMDSAEFVNDFHKLANERYDKLLDENRLRQSEIQLWDPDRKNFYSFIPLNDKTLWCSADIHKTADISNSTEIYLSTSKYFKGGEYLEIWSSLEKNVLDELGVIYQKDRRPIIRNWYARWFFNNQLYIIGVALLILITCFLIKKKNQKRQSTVTVSLPTSE